MNKISLPRKKINDKVKKPRLVYPIKEILSIIFDSFPDILNRIGNKGNKPNNRTAMYAIKLCKDENINSNCYLARVLWIPGWYQDI